MKRKIISLILVSALITALFSACASKKTEYIGIVSAMDNEIELLLKEAETERVDTIAGTDYHVGTLRGKPVVIAKAGIGKIRVASGITAMLEHYPISQVIFTGIAGGVADDTQVLDVVIADKLVEHDYGIISNDGFLWRSGDPGYGNTEGLYYECDSYLVDVAYNSAVGVVGEDHTFKGTIATGDQFVASAEYVSRLKNDYNAYACEMEGAAAAVVCMKYDTPFVVIRALSDKADGNAHESYEGFGDIACSNSSQIVLGMLDSIGAQK